MFTSQFGLFWIFLLCCCKKSEVSGKLSLKTRTCMALAGETVVHQLEVTIPVNSTKSNVICYQNSQQVWRHSIDQNKSPNQKKINLSANINMHNISCSGEYYFEYMNEKVYWVVLVRDVGYLPDVENSVIPLLIVIVVLLLLSITGSVYIFKWYKIHSPSERGVGKVKTKRKRNTVVTEEAARSDSVYTALEQRTVSVYDVLNVDKDSRASTEGQTSKKKAKLSPEEEGVFESVYENL